MFQPVNTLYNKYVTDPNLLREQPELVILQYY
jgi:hypothetical protein